MSVATRRRFTSPEHPQQGWLKREADTQFQIFIYLRLKMGIKYGGGLFPKMVVLNSGERSNFQARHKEVMKELQE